ncbi:hypothetical protein A9Z40_03045 [Microbacterium arborescens]|uniref:Uncharacterized protein n=1 Tax=Microbacterium arborescens TaxID=33883 RepID=A0ABX2WIE2_9MICO|nr:hypothetical protein [Microbacterium arborescens]OAZ40933.1 hypothetical protein A9Z40_03045 [Microbacterium arborescens]
MHTEPEFTLWDGYLAEWQRTIDALTLPVPDGFTFPALPPGDPEAKVLYAVGCGEVAAMLTWITAVECAVIEAHLAGDHSTADRWLSVAALWPRTSTYKTYNDPDVPITWREAVLIPALAGDFSKMQEHATGVPTAPNGAD